jgi:asparagine synthase (glutamine-hydrolysing)
MVFAAFQTATAEERARQPFLREDGLLVSWDGRLDHAEELAERLGAPARTSAPELAALAFRRWGDAFAGELLGDFALALWDPAEERLLLVRDPMALRPLYYTIAGDVLLWASRLETLLSAAPVSREIDDDWVAGYLINRPDPAASPYRAIRAVPPAHTIAASRGRIGPPRRFWRIDPEREIRFARDEEYEERFRELFVDSVRSRLDAPGTVVCDLSGGLDSSSIACVAHHLVRTGSVPARRIVTVSYVYEASPSADERRWIRPVEEWLGKPGVHLRDTEHPLLVRLEEPFSEVPVSRLCARELQEGVERALESHGSRVLLSGFGGDHVAFSQAATPVLLGDLVRRGKLAELPAAFRFWNRALGLTHLDLVWHGVIRPFLPRSLRLWDARAAIRKSPWIDRRFARRTAMAERSLESTGGYRLPSRRERFADVETAIEGSAYTYSRWGRQPFEARFPFLDRRLVEFCLACPTDQFLRNGEGRSLHRRALTGLVPPETLARKDKRGNSESLLRAFAREAPQLAALFGPQARVFERGYVDRKELLKLLEKARIGLRADALVLFNVIALEMWLREIEKEEMGICEVPSTRVGSARG